MCAIAGIFHIQTAKPVDPARVRRMADAIAHRGPDGSGVWTAPGVGLGHRHLSIGHADSGAQPMALADGSIAVSYDGEIDNFAELRRELQAAGFEFSMGDNAEIILHSWRHWGVDCVTRFHGIFAISIYDARTKQLFLVRDRLGVKPLFYANIPDGSVIFGSELKALMAHPALRRDADPLAVDDYMAFGFVPDHRSILSGAKKLPAGHYLLLQQGRILPEPCPYWDMDFSARARGGTRELGEEYLRLMRQAVMSAAGAAVSPGVFLCGDVQTSAIVALMAGVSRKSVPTYSLGLDGDDGHEIVAAAHIAERFATRHHARKVAMDDFGVIDLLVRHFDEPFAAASALHAYHLCKFARENVTVAISGDGADEAMAGLDRHIAHFGEEKIRKFMPQSIFGPVFGVMGHLCPGADWARPAKSRLQSLSRTAATAYAGAMCVTHPQQRDSLYSSAFKNSISGYCAEHHVHQLMENAPARSGLDRAQYADMKISLPGNILTRLDRTSMAAGLGVRVPLLDHRLVEFAATLPDKMRVRRGQGNFLAKNAFKQILPKDIVGQPKMAPDVPISHWLRGPLAQNARDIATSATLSQLNWFDNKALAKLADDHIAARADNGRILWQLIMLEKSVARLFA